MTVHMFTELPAEARVWIYGAERALARGEVRALEAHMDRFLAEWRSHGRAIEPAWRLEHDRFLIIGVDERAMSLSGCSIDSMFRTVEDFGKTTGLSFSRSGNRVFYRDAGDIRCVDRPGFAELARQGSVNEKTVVFNNTVATAGELRSGLWEVPMRDSWHLKAFGKSLLPSG